MNTTDAEQPNETLISRLLVKIDWIFFVVLGVALLFLYYHCLVPKDVEPAERNLPEHIRNMIFLLGAVGGLYGLILARRRQKTFADQIDHSHTQTAQGQEQVRIGQRQNFNEQLGRSIELLSHKDIAIRSAGVREFENMAMDDSISQDQRRLIGNIIHDFLEFEAMLPDDDALSDHKKLSRKERLDHELAVHALIKIQNKYEIFTDNEKLKFEKLDLRGFRFENTELHPAKVCFDHCNLSHCSFTNVRVSGTNKPHIGAGGDTGESLLVSSNLHSTFFSMCLLKRTTFTQCDFINMRFLDCRIMVVFDRCEFTEAEMRMCDLSKTRFGSVIISLAHNPLPSVWGCDISNCIFDSPLNTDLNLQLFGDIFFEHNQKPSLVSLETNSDLDSHIMAPNYRGYKWAVEPNTDVKQRYFVKSDKEYSENFAGRFRWESRKTGFPFYDISTEGIPTIDYSESTQEITD